MNQISNKQKTSFLHLLSSIGELSKNEINRLSLTLDQYIYELNKMVSHRGPNETVKIFKSYYSLCVKLTLGAKYEPMFNTRADKSGYPKFLSLVKPWLTSDSVTHKRLGLSVAKLYLSIVLPAKPDTRSITDPCSGELSISNKWTKFLTKYCKKFRPQEIDWRLRWHRTTKVGPNGPALLCSILDLESLRRDPVVLDNLLQFTELTNSWLNSEIKTLLDSTPRLEGTFSHSKLAFLPEGGGKIRTIAIGDYFTQEALTPIFNDTMRFLKELPSDGTYKQSNCIEKMKLAMDEGKPIFCLDLSNATDRFPVFLQENLLTAIYGPKLANLWRKLLTDRSFSCESKDVRYAVGQPMGFLSSWSVFALTHHAFIAYCASRCGLKDFTDYVILGDDVAIFHSAVAERYQILMKKLGVLISQTKSFVWQPGDKAFPHGEFAKRILWRKEEITPVPFDLLNTFFKNPVKEFLSTKSSLVGLGIRLNETPALFLADSFPCERIKKQLSILATMPETLMGSQRRVNPKQEPILSVSVRGKTLWPEDWLIRIPSVLCETLLTEFQTKLDDISRLTDSMEDYSSLIQSISRYQLGTKVRSSVLTRMSSIKLEERHPFVRVTRDLRRELVKLVLETLPGSAHHDYSDPAISADTWLRVLTITDDYFGCYLPKKSKLSRVQSNMVLKIHAKLESGYIPKVVETIEEFDDSAKPNFWACPTPAEIAAAAAMWKKTLPG